MIWMKWVNLSVMECAGGDQELKAYASVRVLCLCELFVVAMMLGCGDELVE